MQGNRYITPSAFVGSQTPKLCKHLQIFNFQKQNNLITLDLREPGQHVFTVVYAILCHSLMPLLNQLQKEHERPRSLVQSESPISMLGSRLRCRLNASRPCHPSGPAMISSKSPGPQPPGLAFASLAPREERRCGSERMGPIRCVKSTRKRLGTCTRSRCMNMLLLGAWQLEPQNTAYVML